MSIDKSKLPRHKVEEIKRREDEKLTKELYRDFAASFDDPGRQGKAFVRGGTVHQDEKTQKREFSSKNAGKLYKPTPMFKPEPTHAANKRLVADEGHHDDRPQRLGKRRLEEKKTSNLETFKEELKRMQEERAERKKIRQQIKEQLGITEDTNLDKIAGVSDPYSASYDSDPNTTNVYLSNLSPKITEDQLCQLFGKFGPLASVKIMWPRTDEEHNRGYMCGFTAYMTRKDGDRAIAVLKGRTVFGFEMRMGWGKQVAMPAIPVYIPPRMLEMTLPPPPSGLPFNCQPREKDLKRYTKRWPLPRPGMPYPENVRQRRVWDRLLRHAIVKVVIPTERPLLILIHRTIEFVVREGPMFEAMLMNREMQNPTFRFLFDNQSPAHVYYRWKLFSILQGESATSWSTRDFRMFKEGSIWRPPPMNFYANGMPEELYSEATRIAEALERSNGVYPCDEKYYHMQDGKLKDGDELGDGKRGVLTESQRDHLEDILRHLTPERNLIAEAMLYCVKHSDASEEIVDCVTESLTNPDTATPKKLARFYLLADILANCSAKVAHVSMFRRRFEAKLEDIMKNMSDTYKAIELRLKAEAFKTRVMACVKAWEDTALFPIDFLIHLQNVFLGLVQSTGGAFLASTQGGKLLPLPVKQTATTPAAITDDNLDGVPLESGDIDGVPLEAADPPASAIPPAKRSQLVNQSPGSSPLDFHRLRAPLSPEMEITKNKTSGSGGLVDYDLDGMPLDEEGDAGSSVGSGSPDFTEPVGKLNGSVGIENRTPLATTVVTTGSTSGFVPSKWETVEPEVVVQQAMTTSKWDLLDQQQAAGVGGKLRNSPGASRPVDGADYDEDLDGVPFDDGESVASTSQSVTAPAETVTGTVTGGVLVDPKPEMTEERRKHLREVEVKVMKYQDELESGKKNAKKGLSVTEQVERYRAKLLKKMEAQLEEEALSVAAVTSKKRDRDGHKNESKSSRDGTPSTGESSHRHHGSHGHVSKRDSYSRTVYLGSTNSDRNSRDGSSERHRRKRDRESSRSPAGSRSRGQSQHQTMPENEDDANYYSDNQGEDGRRYEAELDRSYDGDWFSTNGGDGHDHDGEQEQGAKRSKRKVSPDASRSPSKHSGKSKRSRRSRSRSRGEKERKKSSKHKR